MGALRFMAAGAAEGAGRGVAGYGQMMAQQAAADDAQRRKEELDRAHQIAIADRMGATGRGAGGAAAKPSYIAQLQEMGDALASGKLTGALAAAGMDPGRASDFASMAAGKAPMVESAPAQAGVPAQMDEMTGLESPAVDAQPAKQVAKYNPGDGQALLQEGFSKLRRAVGIVSPEAADNIAQAEKTEGVTGLIKKFAEGRDPENLQAGRAALVAQGKDVYNASGDAITGEASAGTVAAAKIKESESKAKASDSKASKDDRTDPNIRGKGGSGKGGGTSQETKTLDKLIAAAEQDVDNARAEVKGATGLAARKSAQADLEAAKARKAELVTRREAGVSTPATAPTKPAAAPARPGSTTVTVGAAGRPALADIFKR